jgi:hypothetical protein
LRGSWCWRPHTWCRHQPEAAAPDRTASRIVVANPNGPCRTDRLTERGHQPKRPVPNRKASHSVVASPNGSCRAERRSINDGTHEKRPLEHALRASGLSQSAQPRPAGDAAGAARNLAVFYHAVSCRHAPRFTHLPAAHLRAIVGPPSARMALAEGIAHRDLHVHLRAKDGVRTRATTHTPQIERRCPHHCDRTRTLNPNRQLFRTTATVRVPQPEKAVIPHQRDFKPASARTSS